MDQDTIRCDTEASDGFIEYAAVAIQHLPSLPDFVQGSTWEKLHGNLSTLAFGSERDTGLLEIARRLNNRVEVRSAPPLMREFAASNFPELSEVDGARRLADCFNRVIARAVATHGVEVSASVLRSAFEVASKSWCSSSVEYEVVLPLTGVAMPGRLCNPMVLESNLALVDPWDRIDLEKATGRGAAGDFLSRPRDASSLLIATVRVDKSCTDGSAFDRECRKMVGRLMALRLASGAKLRADRIVMLACAEYQTVPGLATCIAPMSSFAGDRDDYSSEWVPDTGFSERVTKYLAAISSGALAKLEVALHRFGFADSPRHPEDTLIDLTIALEATLLAGIRDELSYRLAMRGCVLLEETDKPQEVCELLKAAYSARSKVVHGGERFSAMKPNDLAGRPQNEFLDSLRSLTHRVLVHFADRAIVGEDPAAAATQLDRRIVEAVSRQRTP